MAKIVVKESQIAAVSALNWDRLQMLQLGTEIDDERESKREGEREKRDRRRLNGPLEAGNNMKLYYIHKRI